MKRLDAEQSFAALGHPIRFEALLLVTQAGHHGVAASDIAKSLRLPLTTLSFHLGKLHKTDLVNRRREGARVIYSANRPKLKQMALFLGAWEQAGL
jgi:DNA-binding transcriptional ArsR family regulator